MMARFMLVDTPSLLSSVLAAAAVHVSRMASHGIPGSHVKSLTYCNRTPVLISRLVLENQHSKQLLQLHSVYARLRMNVLQ
jgi:hypothetical protein